MAKALVLTTYQQALLDALRRGEKLTWAIGGVYYKHKKLRVETVDALVGTGELAAVGVKGRFMTIDFVVHQSKVDTIKKKVVNVISPLTSSQI